jgi:hypothetical protein
MIPGPILPCPDNIDGMWRHLNRRAPRHGIACPEDRAIGGHARVHVALERAAAH